MTDTAKKSSTLRAGTDPSAIDPKTDRDLLELTRQYRRMEGDRKHYTEESQRTLRRQNRLIERLKDENEKLRDRVAAETRFAQSHRSRRDAEVLARLQQQKQALETHIAEEKERLQQASKKAAQAREELVKLRKTQAAAVAGQPSPDLVERQVHTLENRLQQAVMRYNTVLAANRNLREEIASLRRERLAFEQQYASLGSDAETRQAEIQKLVDSSNEEHQRRSKAQSQVKMLVQLSAREAQAFEEEWKELGRILEREERRVGAERTGVAATARLDEQRDTDDPSPLSSELGDQEEEQFASAFKQVLVAAGEWPEDSVVRPEMVDSLVSRFVEEEDRNFSLFNYTNELRTEVELREEELFRLREELSAAQEQKHSADATLRQVVAGLEEQLSTNVTTAEAYESQFETLKDDLTGVCDLVGDLFSSLGCKALPGIASTDQVNTENVLQHLSAVEEACNGMLERLTVRIRNGDLPPSAVDGLLQEIPAANVGSLTPSAVALLQARAAQEGTGSAPGTPTASVLGGTAASTIRIDSPTVSRASSVVGDI